MSVNTRLAQRRARSRIVYSSAVVLGLVVGVTLLITLRALILPTVIGALLAYISTPLLTLMKRRGLPHGVAILLLFASVTGALAFVGGQVRAIIPDERGKLILRVRIQYKLNQRYRQAMGLSEKTPDGNFVYALVGKESAPVLHQLNNVLALEKEELVAFRMFLEDYGKNEPLPQKYYQYHLDNLQRAARERAAEAKDQAKKKEADVDQKEATKNTARTTETSALGKVMAILSLWIVTPFVFLFLLMDDGSIKKWLVTFVPNRYFEMTLTLIDNVDVAIGKYLRGTIMECSLVGLTIGVCLYLVGFEFQWALIIGMVAGGANAIPFLGPVIGLVVGAGYALIVEDISAPLPFFTADNLVLGVLISVGIAQLLDNAIFQPVVLGGAVNLHPLVVVLGVVAGSILFGFAGMLFAIPTIVICRVFVSTLFKQLQAYYII